MIGADIWHLRLEFLGWLLLWRYHSQQFEFSFDSEHFHGVLIKHRLGCKYAILLMRIVFK